MNTTIKKDNKSDKSNKGLVLIIVFISVMLFSNGCSILRQIGPNLGQTFANANTQYQINQLQQNQIFGR